MPENHPRTLCFVCGSELWNGELICGHHTVGVEDWAQVNRIACDLLHRGIEPDYSKVVPDPEEPWYELGVPDAVIDTPPPDPVDCS